MNKLTTMVLMLCLTLSGAFCYANDVTGIEFGKRIPLKADILVPIKDPKAHEV